MLNSDWIQSLLVRRVKQVSVESGFRNTGAILLNIRISLAQKLSEYYGLE